MLFKDGSNLLTDTCVTKLKNFSVHDILTPTSAIADYAIGLERLSANGQLFDDAETAVSL